MIGTRLDLARPQILAFRRHAGALDERLPRGKRSLRRAAWRRLSRAERDAVAAEALALPLPGTEGRIVVRWDD